MRADIAALTVSVESLTAAVTGVQAKIATLPVLEGDDIQGIEGVKAAIDAATATLQGIAG
jgi:hypothetical protein